MTVLPCISQVVYTINDNRYTCYTDYENRAIAKLLLSEEYLKLEVDNLTLQSLYTSSIIDNLEFKLTNWENTNIQLEVILDKYQTTTDSLNTVNNELLIVNTKQKKHLKTSIIIIIALTALHIL